MALSLRRRPKTLSRHQCRRIVRLLHRSCPLSFCGLENSRRLSGIRSSTAQLLHSGVLHVYLASFVFGAKCAPLPTTAAFSSPAMDCTPPPFSSPGVAKTGHPLSSENYSAPDRKPLMMSEFLPGSGSFRIFCFGSLFLPFERVRTHRDTQFA